MLADAHSSTQTCKWWQSSICWMCCITPSYSRRTHQFWKQDGWNFPPSTLHRIVCIKISGTDSPYSDLQVIAELHFWVAQYSKPKFYRGMHGDRWKDLIRQNHTQIRTLHWSLSKAYKWAWPSTEDGVHPQREWVPQTRTYYRSSGHGDSSRHLEQYLSQTRIK